LRFGETAGGVRLFIDGLAGMAKVNSSRAAITWRGGLAGFELNSLPFSVTSPAVEAGAGLDVPIRQQIEARVRGSWLSTDLYKSFDEGWNHSTGVSAGVVLKQ
jgi:hypothetical protein